MDYRYFETETPRQVAGIDGRFTHLVAKSPALWFGQQWISGPRRCTSYGPGAMIRAEVRYDDSCGNGHNSFAITADIYQPPKTPKGRREELAGGCCHDEIAAAFPELAHLIPWHLTSADGPMHYLANAVYHAGDRDYHGLRKGEKRAQTARDGSPLWSLEAIHAPGLAISKTPTGEKFKDAPALPLYILDTTAKGEEPPPVPVLRWVQSYTVGEGKARELDHARRAAVWPEATDAELSVEPEELRAVLAARLPELPARFRREITAAGLFWSPESSGLPEVRR